MAYSNKLTAVFLIVLVAAIGGTRTRRNADGVVFSAGLDRLVTPSMGSDLVFPNVRLNRGGGYNDWTGIFTAPFAGLYNFNLALRLESRDTFIYCRLQKNGNSFASLSAGDRDNINLSSTSAYAELEEGDEVKVYVDAGTRDRLMQVSHWNYTVFSGHLIY